MRRFDQKGVSFAVMTAVSWMCGGCTMEMGTELEEVDSVEQALGYSWQNGWGTDPAVSFFEGRPVCEARLPFPLEGLGWHIGHANITGCFFVSAFGSEVHVTSGYRTLHGGPFGFASPATVPPQVVRSQSPGERALCINNVDNPIDKNDHGTPGYVVGSGTQTRCRIKVLFGGPQDITNFKYITWSVLP